MDKKEHSNNKWEVMNKLGLFISNIDKQIGSYKSEDTKISEIADINSEMVATKNYYAYSNMSILENIDKKIKELKRDIEHFDNILTRNNIRLPKKLKMASYMNRLTQAKTTDERISITNEVVSSITRLMLCANNMRKLTDKLFENMTYAQISFDKLALILNNPCIIHYDYDISKNKLLDYINIDSIKNMIENMKEGISYGSVIISQGKEKLAMFKKINNKIKILISDLTLEESESDLTSAEYDKDKIIEILSCSTKKSVISNIQKGIKYSNDSSEIMKLLINTIAETTNKDKEENNSKATKKKDNNSSIIDILITLKSLDILGNIETYPNLMRLNNYRYIRDCTSNGDSLADIIADDLKNNEAAIKISETGCTSEDGEMIYNLEINI